MGMTHDLSGFGLHPSGEPSAVADQGPPRGVLVDSFTGPVHVEWDREAAFTPLGQLPFFIDFLKTAGLFDVFVADCWARRRSPAGPGARRSQYTAPFQWTPTMCSVAAFCGGRPVMAGTISATIFDVDGVLVNSPHERAWREALAGFADPAQFTTTFYQTYVAGKPRPGHRSGRSHGGAEDVADPIAELHASPSI